MNQFRINPAFAARAQMLAQANPGAPVMPGQMMQQRAIGPAMMPPPPMMMPPAAQQPQQKTGMDPAAVMKSIGGFGQAWQQGQQKQANMDLLDIQRQGQGMEPLSIGQRLGGSLGFNDYAKTQPGQALPGVQGPPMPGVGGQQPIGMPPMMPAGAAGPDANSLMGLLSMFGGGK